MGRRILGRLGAALTCATGVLLAVATAASVSRATVNYQTPAVTLVRADGQRVSLPHELDDGRPVLLNFIFTTCSSICPLTSRTLEEFQDKLGRANAAWLTLDAGAFESVEFDATTGALRLGFAAGTQFTSSARLRIEQPSKMKGAGIYHPVKPLNVERGAYIIPLTTKTTWIELALPH